MRRGRMPLTAWPRSIRSSNPSVSCDGSQQVASQCPDRTKYTADGPAGRITRWLGCVCPSTAPAAVLLDIGRMEGDLTHFYSSPPHVTLAKQPMSGGASIPAARPGPRPPASAGYPLPLSSSTELRSGSVPRKANNVRTSSCGLPLHRGTP